MNSGTSKRNPHLVERVKLLTETTEICLKSIEVRNRKIQSLKISSDYWEGECFKVLKLFAEYVNRAEIEKKRYEALVSNLHTELSVIKNDKNEQVINSQNVIKELRIELKNLYDRNSALERKVKTTMVSAESSKTTSRGTSSVIRQDKDCSTDYSCSDDSFSRTGISAMIRKPVALGPIQGLCSRKFAEGYGSKAITNKPPRACRPSECKSKKIESIITTPDKSNETLARGESVRRSRFDSPRPTPRMGCATPRRVRRSLSVPHQSPLERGETSGLAAFGRSVVAPKPLMPSSDKERLVAVCSDENIAIITDDDSINLRNINSYVEERSLITSKDESESFGLNKQETVFSRAHNCKETRVYLRDVCDVCGKRLGMGQMAMRCSVCRQMCHEMCYHRLTKPCAPRRIDMPKLTVGQRYSLPDWCCENIRPMVPYSLIVSVTYLDRHHLAVENIYKCNYSEGLVQELMHQFRNQRMHPVLSRFDPHCIAGYVKTFIKALGRPLIPPTSYREFASGSLSNESKVRKILLNAFEELPIPNRDTLSFLFLHWKRVVSHSDANGMTAENLSQVLGTTVAERGVKNQGDIDEQIQIVRVLLDIEDDFYLQNLRCDAHPSSVLSEKHLPRTPSYRFTFTTPKEKSIMRSVKGKSPWK